MFIYVMSENDKNRLVDAGAVLVKEDLRNSVWVLTVGDGMNFNLDDIPHVISYSLSF